MQGLFCRRSCTVAIVVLFIGVGVVPSIADINEINQNSKNILITNVEGDGDAERWAIAMGFAFDGIMKDAYCLRDILHNNSPEIWPLDHIKLYSHDSWDNIIEGLRWIESQEDSNDITIWQSAGHGNPDGIASENGFISYADLDREFDKFDGFLLIMICACGSCYAHTKLAGENRIIITGRSPLNSLPCDCQKTDKSHYQSASSLWTYFIMHFVHPSYGAWGNEICDSVYGNNDGWVSAEEAFTYVEDSFEWPDEIWNNWCYAHLYMTDGVPGNLNITFIQENNQSETPSTPSIEGPLYGETGETYSYNIRSIDPEDDDISYIIDWGDNQEEELGPNPSGETVTANHIWDEQGIYIIRVKAKDIHNFESDWATLEVSMPKTKPHADTLFLRFLENHSHLFPLLRHLLGV